jgi:hypothetical protein
MNIHWMQHIQNAPNKKIYKKRTHAPAYPHLHFQTKSEAIFLKCFVHSDLFGHRQPVVWRCRRFHKQNMVCAYLSLLPKRISTDSTIGRWGAWLGVPGSSLLIISNAKGGWPSLLPVMTQVRHRC